jgi:hypothetical protein
VHDAGPIVIALVSSVPATIAALAAWRGVSNTNKKADEIKRQVTPSNGEATAAIVEAIRTDVRSVKDDLAYHVTVQHGRGPLRDHEEEEP